MKTTIELKIGGKSVAEVISRYAKAVTYREVLDGEADTLELTLHDAEKKFIGEWYPPRGTSVELNLVDEEFNRLELGEFVIDEIENSYPPSECKIKATSIPPGCAAKNVERSRSWEGVYLSQVASDIAIGAGLRLIFDTTDNPRYERVEQSEESDLKFLHRLCRDKGMALKVNDKQLIIFDYERYERRSAIATIGAKDYVKRFNARQTLNEVYTDCEVKYHNGLKGQLYSGAAGSRKGLRGLLGGRGRTLKINAKAANDADAMTLAKKKLAEKNREETKVTLTMLGDFRYRAGMTITLEDFAAYNGKYLIQKATHGLGGDGYEVTLELTKCGE